MAESDDLDRMRKVFVVHGRNAPASLAIFTFLRSIDLAPIEWGEAVNMTAEGAPYIGQVLDTAFDAAQAVVVLLTPDDIAYLQQEYASGEDDPDTEPAGQARPNVLFEAGMAMGRNPQRTILVELGKVRPFSDVAGRHAIRLDNTAPKRNDLAQRLNKAGCEVNLTGSDWLTAGDFTLPGNSGLPLGKRLPSSSGLRGVRLDAHFHERSSGGVLEITNRGSIAVYDLNVELPEDVYGFRIFTNDLPLKRLPGGRSIMLRCSLTMPRNSDNFDIILTGKTDEGQPVREEVFISLVG